MMNDKKISDEELGVMLRTDLGLFIERVFMHLYPNQPYLGNWHIELIASKLEDVLAGKTTRLIINVPPRSLKSVTASIAFVAWALGRDPTKQIICASYGQDLADKLAQDCRSVMQSEWYRRLFGVYLEGSRPSIADFRTTKGGGRFATSVGGVLTGRGADIIVIDDPLKPDDALSDAERQRANDWFDGTVMSRLNDKRTGAMIIIMQRLHMDDLVGHVLSLDDWEQVVLPAIAETEEHFSYENVLGKHEIVRYPGEALHPERESLKTLDNMRRIMTEYNFAGQYQQSPVPLGGGIFKLEWISYYAPNELPDKFDQIVQSWDTANKETEMSDFSVCITVGVKGNYRYVLNILRNRMEFPSLKKAVVEQHNLFKPNIILIEDKASGTQLIQELRAQGLSKIKACKTVGDKFTRANPQTAAFEGGFVKLPQQAPWLDAYLSELTTFPRAKYDDQVDATSQILGWLSENRGVPGLIMFYRNLNDE